MASKNVSVTLGLVDKFTKPLKEVQTQIKETTEGIAASAKRVEELRAQLISRADISKMASKEERAAAKAANQNLNAQIDAEKALKDAKKANLALLRTEEKESKKAATEAVKKNKKVQASIQKISLAIKSTVALAAASAIFDGVKTAFSAATELETLRSNIETVTKSATRASTVMEHAVNLANFSAFDNAELIEAASMLETYGLQTEQYLTAIGDAAAITGRDVAEMSKAFGKAVVSGQFDSLADIGITRQKLDAFAKSKGIKLFDGTKIRDQKLMAETLKDFMNSRYAGGMAKQANTLAGMWSTVQGITKNALANMVGVYADGTIKAGGMMDKLRSKLEGVMNTLTRWEQDGTMEKIAETVGKLTDKVFALGDQTEKTVTSIGKMLEPFKPVVEWLLWIADGLYMVSNAFQSVPSAVFDAVANLKPIEVNMDVSGWWNSMPSTDTPAHALGTSYHSGGAALVGEHGPEIATFPSGTKVTSASGTRALLRGGGHTINIYIQGAQRSDEQIADTVAARLLEALDNV